MTPPDGTPVPPTGTEPVSAYPAETRDGAAARDTSAADIAAEDASASDPAADGRHHQRRRRAKPGQRGAPAAGEVSPMTSASDRTDDRIVMSPAEEDEHGGDAQVIHGTIVHDDEQDEAGADDERAGYEPLHAGQTGDDETGRRGRRRAAVADAIRG